MLTKEIFKIKIDEFTKELSSKFYTERIVQNMYEKLSYLVPSNFNDALNMAVLEFPQGYLPLPIKLIDFIVIRFKRPMIDDRTYNQGKDCGYCGNTGQVVRDLIKCDTGNPSRVYRCFCDRGKSFSEEYFPTWSRRLQAMHHPGLGPNNQDNAGYSKDETVPLANTIPSASIVDYSVFKKLNTSDVGLDLYINKEELSQLEIDICKDIYKE